MLLSSFLPHSSVFLIVFSFSLLISFLCYFAIVFSDVFSVLFLTFRGLSVVSPSLCRTSLLLFLVNQSSFRSSLVLDFVGGHNFFVVRFAITPPPPPRLYGFPLFCNLPVINDHFFLGSSAIANFLLIAQ